MEPKDKKNNNKLNKTDDKKRNTSRKDVNVKISNEEANENNRSTKPSTLKKILTSWYTNADTFTNKKSELLLRIKAAEKKPDVILINELKPKYSRYKLSEVDIKLEGYNNFSINLQNNIGRGCIIYVNETLIANELKLETQFDESIWVEISLLHGEKLLIGNIYRSPNSNSENNDKLIQLLGEITKLKIPNTVVTGDLNIPGVDWETWTTPKCSTNSLEYKFIESLRDNFLFQHVSKCTRGRGNDIPTLLDLVLTYDELLISDISYKSPLGKSDHSMLEFDIHCEATKQNKVFRRFYYNKGNFNEMRKSMELDWEKIFEDFPNNPEAQWNIFKEKIKEAENIYVPNRLVNTGQCKRKGPPLDKKTIQEKRKKHRMWQRYMETKDPTKFKAYRKQSNKVRGITRKVEKTQEAEICRSAKSEPKKFWAYIHKKLKHSPGVADLKLTENGEERLTNTNQEKAEVLGTFFSSVFTQEINDTIPEIKEREYERELKLPEITNTLVQNKLKILHEDKSPGPDGIHPKVLKELSPVISKPLAEIIKISLKTGILPEEWKTANITALYKKGKKIWHQTTDQ